MSDAHVPPFAKVPYEPFSREAVVAIALREWRLFGQNVADPEADSDPLRTHRLATRSPLGRFGTPDEVVHVVLALLDATWATGEIWGVGR